MKQALDRTEIVHTKARIRNSPGPVRTALAIGQKALALVEMGAGNHPVTAVCLGNLALTYENRPDGRAN